MTRHGQRVHVHTAVDALAFLIPGESTTSFHSGPRYVAKVQVPCRLDAGEDALGAGNKAGSCRSWAWANSAFDPAPHSGRQCRIRTAPVINCGERHGSRRGQHAMATAVRAFAVIQDAP